MDIDIDFKTTFSPKDVFKTCIPASVVTKDGILTKHNCGVYFQQIAVDPVTELAAIPYDNAEKLGYFKIDMLHLGVLDNFNSKQEIRDLLEKKPKWDLLMDAKNVEKLFHLSKHFDIVQKVKPRSVQELADALALIRPGKRQLLDKYVRNKRDVRPLLYQKQEGDQYSFKKSHAIAYALTIVLQLHLIEQGRI